MGYNIPNFLKNFLVFSFTLKKKRFLDYLNKIYLKFKFWKNKLYTVVNKQIRYVYQEANKYVDALTNLGITLLSKHVPFVKSLDVVECWPALDMVEHSCNKLINS